MGIGLWGPEWGVGDACFEPDGEIFGLRDNRKDGRGVVAEWSVSSRDSGGGQLWNTGRLWNTSGYSTSYKTFDLSFNEGALAEFHVCLEDGGTLYVDTCGAYAHVTAWSDRERAARRVGELSISARDRCASKAGSGFTGASALLCADESRGEFPESAGRHAREKYELAQTSGVRAAQPRHELVAVSAVDGPYPFHRLPLPVQ